MNREATLSQMLSLGIVAVIRMTDGKPLLRVVEAICEGGVKCIEITMTVPNAVEMIREISKTVPSDVIVGAGTVLNAETARAVIEAGARFVVAPILNRDVIDVCHAHDVVAVSGCFTPTEIVSGWDAGADIIKVFPSSVLGPTYFKDVRGPLPHIRMMPTGGVTIENVGEWVAAGAVAVAIGSDLLDKSAIARKEYQVLTERARRLVQNYRVAREKAVSESEQPQEASAAH